MSGQRVKTPGFVRSPAVISNTVGGRESLVRKKHHQLTNYFTERQNMNVSSLLSVLEKNLSFRVDCPFLNFITGQIFTDEVYTSVTSFEETGKKLVEEFIQNRLKPNSSVSIFAPLKKAKLKLVRQPTSKEQCKFTIRSLDYEKMQIFLHAVFYCNQKERSTWKMLLGIMS